MKMLVMRWGHNMINYNDLKRQALVAELVAALGDRSTASANFPFTAWQFWQAGRRASKIERRLNEYDRDTLQRAFHAAAEAYYKLPMWQRDGSHEEDVYVAAVHELGMFLEEHKEL